LADYPSCRRHHQWGFERASNSKYLPGTGHSWYKQQNFQLNGEKQSFCVIRAEYLNALNALSATQDHIHRESISAVRVAAFPQPFSTFNWKIIIETEAYFAISYMNLSCGYTAVGDGKCFWDKIRSTYKTPEQMSWQRQRRFGDAGPEAERVEMLRRNEQLDYIRRFAELPVLYHLDQDKQTYCVLLTDLRYIFPYMTPPFIYGLCRETNRGLNRLRH
jgi:inner membrane protein